MSECDFKEHPDMECEGDVKERISMTQYNWSGEGKDPNRVICCESCYQAYVEFWTEQWSDYYAFIGR